MRVCLIFLFFITTALQSCQLVYDKAADALKNGKWDEAYEMLIPLVTDNPDKPDLLYDTGVAAYNKDKFSQALVYFDHAATKTDDNTLKINAYFNAGNACIPLKELHKAIKYYDLVLSIDSTNEYAQHNKKCVEEMLKQQEQQQKQEDQQKDQQKDEQDKQEQQKDQSQQDCGDKDDNNQGDDESQKESDQKEGSDGSDSSKGDTGQKERNKEQKPTNAQDNKQRDSKNQSKDQFDQKQEQQDSKQGNQHKNSPQDQQEKQEQQKHNDSNVASENTQDQAEKEKEHAQVAAQQGEEGIAQALKEALNDPWLSQVLQKQEERDKATNRQLMEAKMRHNGGKNAYNNW